MRKLKNSWKPLGFLFRQAIAFPLLSTLTLLTLLITVAMNIAIPYLSKPIVNDCILNGDLPRLAKYLLLLGAMYVVQLLAAYLNARVLVRLSQKVSRALRTTLFDKMQLLPMGFFDQKTHGELMSAYTNDVDTISNFVSTSVSSLITSVLSFAGILVVLLTMSPILTLVSMVFIVLQYIIMKKSGGLSRKYFVQQQADLASLNGYIEEMTEGQKVVKVFCRERQAIDEFERRNQSLQNAAYTAQVYAGIIMPALGGIASINDAMTCTAGVILMMLGMFDIGSLVAFIKLMQDAGHQVGSLANLINMVLAAVAGTERIMAILEQPSEVDTGTLALTNDRWSNGTPLEGHIVFEDAEFSYVPGHPILKNISFAAHPGKKIALVGSTGAGKTTIVSLLSRFYELSGGSVRYDGVDIRDIRKDALRKTMSLVLQDTHLFTDTVRENIRFGRENATDAEVEAAARLANADFFIRHLPQGYDTLLTDDGSSLSQGQRQLLAIARAAVANPAILILDEATSSIDTRTEKLIESGMDRLMEGRTVFIIAHRLSTVRTADTILVLEHGEIVERGTHEELLALCGRYYDLYTGKVELA